MDTNEKYSYKELQEMLPDYVFGRLSEDEKLRFEFTMPDYQDIIDEVKQVRSVFARVDTMNFDKIVSDRTRNLSVRVNNRLQKNAIRRRHPFGWRFLTPAISIVAIALFMVYGPYNFMDLLKNKSTELADKHVISEDFLILKPEDISVDSNITDSTYQQIASTVVPAIGDNNSELLNHYGKTNSDLIEQVYADNLLENTEGMTDYLLETNHDDLNILNDLNLLDEDDIQNILQEIDDEDFDT